MQINKLGLAALFVVAATADAQQDTTKTTLPAVSITASRSGLPVIVAPLSVTQIGKASWQGFSGYGLDAALTGVPGVLAQSRYGNSDIRLMIRGFGSRGAGDRSNSGTSRGVRVLINGIPETEPDGRTAFDNVDLGIAQQIDVVRSNASAQWGNAAGGVVNINTIPEYSTPFIEASNAMGSSGLKRFGLSAGTLVGQGRVFGSVFNSSFEGWRKNSMSSRTAIDGGIVAPLGEGTTLKVLVAAALNRFNVPGPLTKAQMDADPTQANSVYLSRRERRDNTVVRVAMTLDHKIDEAQSFSTMAFVQPKYLQRSERNTYRDFNRYHAGANGVYRRADKMGEETNGHLTLGADVAYQDGTILFYNLSSTQGRGTTLSDNKREGANNFGVFGSEDLEIGDKWVLSLGARWDAITYTYSSNITPSLNTTKSFSGVTPKLGLTYKVSPTHTWFANLGGGVEAPAGNETDPEAGTANAVFAINPLLDPIKSNTVELGTRRMFAAGAADDFIRSVSYDAAAFFTAVTNEIVPYNGGRFYFTAGKADRKGAELGATVQAQGGWSLQGAYTWMDATYSSYIVDSVHYAKPGAKADYSGNKIVGVPSSMMSATLGWAPAVLNGIRLQAGMQNIGSYFADDANKISVPSSNVVNVGIVAARPFELGNGFGVRGSVMVTNAADTKYVGSAFLNPDNITISGVTAPAVFEPGLPRQVILSLSISHSKQ